ncbi:MAG: sarcosine oxidase, subunit gamma [Hyphomicrobiales bacterium]|jgi:sarcosine oxidase subunit gamma|nr:sarcosine oxidase, subunit gamma [Hyphomicrobiales bacterium]
MLDVSAMRQGPLDRLAGGVRPGSGVELSLLPPRARFVLRCRPGSVAAAGQALGVALPTEACRAAVSASRAALWLGPDEWLLLAAPEDAAAIVQQFAGALAGAPHALVDVSHRGAAIAVKGAHAATLINHGCALDLAHAAFPAGMCTRTLFEKAEIVLWRTEEHTYHAEIERSFAPYVWRMLRQAREDLA